MRPLDYCIIGVLIAASSVVSNVSTNTPLKTYWQSDGVYYTTNNFVWDDERNKTNTSQLFYYTKTVITTNKQPYWPIRYGDSDAELGLREDGMVVWRKIE